MILQESVVGGCGFDRDALLEVKKATVPSDLVICCSGDQRKSTWRARRFIYTSRTPALSASASCRTNGLSLVDAQSGQTYARECPIIVFHGAEATSNAILLVFHVYSQPYVALQKALDNALLAC